ncbi:hypothetical protein JCM5296_007593 [Sporobolomyces johnsonii]
MLAAVALSLLALASTVLALPAPSSLSPALAVPRAFLAKRQTTSATAAVGGLESLLQEALTATASGGTCSDECSSWIGLVEDCSTLSTYTEIGLCACQDSPLAAMSACGDCFGSSSVSDASDFASYCRENRPASLGSTYSSSSSSVVSFTPTHPTRTASSSDGPAVSSTLTTSTEAASSQSGTSDGGPGLVSSAEVLRIRGAGVVVGLLGAVAAVMMP